MCSVPWFHKLLGVTAIEKWEVWQLSALQQNGRCFAAWVQATVLSHTDFIEVSHLSLEQCEVQDRLAGGALSHGTCILLLNILHRFLCWKEKGLFKGSLSLKGKPQWPVYCHFI